MTKTKELNAVEEKNKRLDDLYMVVGALMFMAEALKKTGTVAHAEKAKQYEALAKHYDAKGMQGIWMWHPNQAGEER